MGSVICSKCGSTSDIIIKRLGYNYCPICLHIHYPFG